MSAVLIAQLVVLVIGLGILLYVLATWRRRDASSRAGGCALAAAVPAVSAWIGALS